MFTPRLQTPALELVLQTTEGVLAAIAAMDPAMKAQLSADWLALFATTASPDPWVHGFSVVHRESGAVVGTCGYKGPPTAEGVVEIAYGIDPEYQGKGYATEAAAALVAYAFAAANVRVVVAHTLPESHASQKILIKCGFAYIGEVVDRDDGLVSKFEKHRDA
jgi:ribosomal-protein-alanine N-acetyltransferase